MSSSAIMWACEHKPKNVEQGLYERTLENWRIFLKIDSIKKFWSKFTTSNKFEYLLL